MKRLHAPRAYDTTLWPDSHWRATAQAAPCPALDGGTTTDVLVIGAGYAGLNAALALAEAGVETMVVDAGQPGWGASGRNGGFCCLGGTKLSDAALVRRFGHEDAARFADFQKTAVAHVDALLGRYGIDADRGPDGEVRLAHSANAWARMQRDAGRGPRGGSRLLQREELRAEGIHSPAVYGAEITPVGFPLHPMKYVLGLAGAAARAGARIHGESPVTALTRDGDGWRADTPRGQVRARRVLIATNGYSSEDLPPWIAGRTLPVFSTILVTRPLSEAERQAQGWTSLAMAYDSRQLLHYFRLLPDGRFLFGMRGGLSSGTREKVAIRAQARRNFEALFPEWRDVETEREWSGLVCLTGSLTPFAGPVPGAEGLFVALGWHGNGVSMASLSGHEVGRMMAGQTVRLPSPLTRPPARFPIPGLRLPMMRLAYAWYGWRDGPVG